MRKYRIGAGYTVGIFAGNGRKFGSVYASHDIMTGQEFDSALEDARHVSRLVCWNLYGFSSRYLFTSIAAMQPYPAAVTACLYL